MLTRSQIAKASADAQVDFCLDKQPTYEVALSRRIESAATAPLLARIAELERELEEARKDAERWKAPAMAEDGHSHACRQCGYSYTPNNSETEDCPRCGFDGVGAAIKEQT